ncbi:MAG: protein kinase [Phycisphaerales bacterium]
MPAPGVDFAAVQALFFEVVDLPPSERERVFRDVGADADVIAEVRGLLSASTDDEFLERPAAIPRELAEGQPHLIGRRVGGFALGRRIGVGGMGVVYEAEQDQPRRTVAVKLIRPELATEETIARFRREAELLGRLQHPGIAMVFEAGADVDPDDPGSPPQPYCAMELVDGEPMTEWADRRHLPTAERIELLARVCDAVDHAHRRGVLHRDLKPANILVTKDGQPKILDFGVARALGQPTGGTMHTMAGDLVGTLGWMSPEQVKGDTEAIDARSDVYALGVIGYELLAGRPAFDLEGLSITEGLHRLCNTDPAPLRRIRPDLGADLSLVIAKATMRDAAARYATAAALADDLRACRDQRPITARPPTTLYWASRFVRRNLLFVAVASAAFVVLAVTAIVAASGWRQANIQADRSRRVNSYLLDAIGTLNPSKMGSNQISLKQALDQLSGQLGAELEAAPDLASAVHQALGERYLEIDANAEAEVHLRAATEARTALYGADSKETWASQLGLAQALRRLDRANEAVVVLEGVVGRMRALGADQLVLAEALNNLGTAQFHLGHVDDSKQAFNEGLAALDQSDATRLGRSRLLGNLASVSLNTGDLKGAVEFGRRAIDLRLSSEGETLDTALALARWSATMLHTGQPGATDEAIAVQVRSVGILRRLLPADSDQLVAQRENLARAFFRVGRWDECADLALENADALEATGRGDVERIKANLQLAASALRESAEPQRRAEVLGRLARYGPIDESDGVKSGDVPRR